MLRGKSVFLCLLRSFVAISCWSVAEKVAVVRGQTSDFDSATLHQNCKDQSSPKGYGQT